MSINRIFKYVLVFLLAFALTYLPSGITASFATTESSSETVADCDFMREKQTLKTIHHLFHDLKVKGSGLILVGDRVEGCMPDDECLDEWGGPGAASYSVEMTQGPPLTTWTITCNICFVLFTCLCRPNPDGIDLTIDDYDPSE